MRLGCRPGVRACIEPWLDRGTVLPLHRYRIRARDGADVRQRESMVYLGASLSADGRVDSEVARRIGAARADFRTLQRVWAHASLAVKDKVRIYEACIAPSLTYGLQTAWPPRDAVWTAFARNACAEYATYRPPSSAASPTPMWSPGQVAT